MIAAAIKSDATFPVAVRSLDIPAVVAEMRSLQDPKYDYPEIAWLDELLDGGILHHFVKKGHFDLDAHKYVVEEYGNWEAVLYTRPRPVDHLVRGDGIVACLLITDEEAAQKDECERRLHALLRDALIQSPVVSEKVTA